MWLRVLMLRYACAAATIYTRADATQLCGITRLQTVYRARLARLVLALRRQRKRRAQQAARQTAARQVQMAFRQHRGVTPLEFLRTLRLDEARKRFSNGSGLSVAEVAGSLGFTHLGRFAGHYRQRFGESPAQTRRKQVGP